MNLYKINLKDKEQKLDSLHKLVLATTEKLNKLEIESEKKFHCFEERMIILKKLSQFSVPAEDMIHIYCMYIRSIAEQSSVVWSSSLSKGEEYDLERVQKVALRVIFKDCYLSYEWALSTTNLPTLKARRAQLSLKFSLKCTKNSRVSDMFPLRDTCIETRNHEKYEVTQARTNRLAQSAIPSMQKQLNKYSMAAK